MTKTWRTVLMVGLLLLTFALTLSRTLAIHPQVLGSSLHLEALVPRQFGDWKEQALDSASVVNPQADALTRQIYSQLLTRLYRNRLDGQEMMLVIAYGQDQRDDLQVHYPEVCYPALGFAVQSNIRVRLSTAFGTLPVRQMQTRLNASRNEPVTYWAMLGEQVVLDGMQKKWTELRLAWDGQRADGLLVRVSSIDAQNQRAFAGQSRFVADLLGALPAADRKRLSGL
ncbi:MAG: EpsI family protein [Rhodoferax sp.]|nr:EpsI family protein [Rhodoferax sp.]